MAFTRDVAIIGGCGHVGLPLGIAFAQAGLTVTLYDLNEASVDKVRAAKMPFWEEGAEEPLERHVGDGSLTATSDPAAISDAEHVVIVVGTPVDDHLNPDTTAVAGAVGGVLEWLRDGQ